MPIAWNSEKDAASKSLQCKLLVEMSLFRLLRPGSGMRKGGSPRHALGV